MFDRNKLKKFEKHTQKNKMPYYEFNTLYELAEIAEETAKYEFVDGPFAQYKYEKQSIAKSNKYKQGTHDFDEAIKLLKYGWELGAQKINVPVKIHSTYKGLQTKYSVVGGHVSVPRMLEGLPTNMVYQKMVEKPQKVLNVYKSAGYNWKYSESEIIDYSTKAVQIVELLEAKGYRVNLFVVKLNVNRNNPAIPFFIKVKVKNSSERINMKKIAFCLAHPAFQRRLLWRLIESCPFLNGRGWYAFGFPVDRESPSAMDKRYEEYLTETNKVFIPIEVGNPEEFVKALGR